MNGLTCDVEFMIRYPYLFTIIMIVFIPSMALLGVKLFAVLGEILNDLSRKGDE